MFDRLVGAVAVWTDGSFLARELFVIARFFVLAVFFLEVFSLYPNGMSVGVTLGSSAE